MDAKKRDYVEKAAYFIWLNNGCRSGCEMENWVEAEKIYELMHLAAPLALSAPRIRAELEARKKAKAGAAKKAFKKTAEAKVTATAAAPAPSAPVKKAAPVVTVAPVAPSAKAKIIPMSRIITKAKVAPAAAVPAKKPAVRGRPATMLPMPGARSVAKKPGLRHAAARVSAPKFKAKEMAAPSCLPKRSSFKKCG